MKSETTTITTIAIIIAVTLLCCLCICFFGFGAFFMLAASADSSVVLGSTTPTPVVELFRPTPVTGQLTPPAPAATPLDLDPVATRTPQPDTPATPTVPAVPVIISTETLNTLQNAL
ncbi:MAG: hypothetical protein HUU38_04545, partial [Anaerolineales bacterium]|nr:hypothetical protein [Anaerolineales bacterium]